MMKKLTENYKITMSIDKQIDEMAKIIDDNHGFIVSSVETAEALYNIGYRKSSEVAREIFAEIESCKWSETQYGDQMLCFEINSAKYAELKKKYESEKDNG